MIASDITAEMLAETAKLSAARGFTNVSTATAHAHELPFEAGRFDLITCRLAAHHFPDMSRFIEKSHAALRTGGILAIVDNVPPDQQSVPELSAADVPAAADAYNTFEKLRDPSHARALSVDEWKGTLAHRQFRRSLDMICWRRRWPSAPGSNGLHCAPETIDQLMQTLLQPSVLSKFLKPREADGELHLTLREAILIAQKQP